MKCTRATPANIARGRCAWTRRVRRRMFLIYISGEMRGLTAPIFFGVRDGVTHSVRLLSAPPKDGDYFIVR